MSNIKIGLSIFCFFICLLLVWVGFSYSRQLCKVESANISLHEVNDYVLLLEDIRLEDGGKIFEDKIKILIQNKLLMLYAMDLREHEFKGLPKKAICKSLDYKNKGQLLSNIDIRLAEKISSFLKDHDGECDVVTR